MKRLLTYFIILLTSVWLGIKIHASAGYVLITYRSWSIETTLWFALLALLAMFLLFYLLLRSAKLLGTLSNNFKSWIKDHQERIARIQTIAGLGELMKGYWGGAEKKLIGAAKNSDMPLINYVAAAYTAQHQAAYERRDNYLRQAQQLSPHNSFTVELVQARLQIMSNQLERALATLHHLKELNPKHPLVLQLLQKVYVALHDWENLRDLLPWLRKRRVLPPTELADLEHLVYAKLLNVAPLNSAIELKKFWHTVPKYLRHTPAIVVLYVDCLLRHNEFDFAETLLKRNLSHTWDESLVECYARINGKNPVKHLALAESWVKPHESAALFLCLGKICKNQMLWGKARYYFEKSVKLSPTREAYYILGEIAEIEHDNAAALAYYRKGAKEILNSKF